MSDQRSSRIELLKEHNLGSLFVNIQAELCENMLWEYTQGVHTSETAKTATTKDMGESPHISKKEKKAIKNLSTQLIS